MSGTALRRNVELFIDRTLSAEARSATLARVARQKLAALQATGEAPRQVQRFVDGVEGAPEDVVRPDGVILYRFRFLANAAAFALAFLQGRSPNGSGTFRNSFYLGLSPGGDGLQGKYVSAASFNPAAVTGDIGSIVIGNTQPYNRRVDMQRDGATVLRFKVPADLYSDAARAVELRFKGLRAVRVYSIDFPNQYLLKQGPRQGKRVHSPALVISTPR